MEKRISSLRVIALFMACFYSTALFFTLVTIDISGLGIHLLILKALLGLLIIASIGVVLDMSWGKKMGFCLNVIAFLFSASLVVISKDYSIAIFGLFFLGAALYFKRSIGGCCCSSKSEDQWKSVLLVDDDEAVVKTIRPALISRGYSVLSANSGEDGMRIAQSQKPDLIILDVIMPGIKGREVCKILKEGDETKDIPVMFLTAKDSPDDIQAEKEAGAVAHLTKPVNIKELISTVKEVIG